MNPEQNKQAFLYIHTSIMQNSLKNRLFGNRKNSKNVRIKNSFA